MTAFRFIHTGDLHLDSPQKTVAAMDDPRADLLKRASRRAFDALVARAKAERVDAMLIAGDLWDGNWSDVSVGLYVQDKVAELKAAGITTVAILGNHDAESAVTGRVRAIADLHIFSSDRPGTLDLGKAVIHGQSFAHPAVLDNLALTYPDAWPGRINIGLLHTALEGDAAHAPYAPCKLSDLSAKRYTYWALGHIHTRAVLQDAPPSGGGSVAYCGVLQGRDVGETGVKGAYLGEANADGVSLTQIDLPFVQWSRIDVDVSEAADVKTALIDAIKAQRGQLDTGVELCVLRVVLTGESAAHEALPLMQRELKDAAETAAGTRGRLLLERVQLATRPRPGGAAVQLPSGFDDDLLTAARSGQVREAARKAAAEVLGALESDAKAALKRKGGEVLNVGDDIELENLMESAAQRLIRRLAVRVD